MTTDIVERLRRLPEFFEPSNRIGLEAADEIERLREQGTILPGYEDGYNDALEEAAKVATSFLVGDPANGISLSSPSPHEIAAAIRAMKGKQP